jgi:hypothetical protein
MTIAPSTFDYAQKLIHKGYGFQNAARIAGMAECDLRALCGAPPPRASMPSRPRRQEPQRPRPQVPLTPSASTVSIIAEVAAGYGLTAADLIGECRFREFAYARHHAMSEVRAQRPGMSLPLIGRIFGGRDHTTVLYGLRCHEARVRWGEALRSMVPSDDDQLDLFAVAA